MALHPSVAAVRRGVRRALAGLPPAPTVLVACSGGADSLALAAAAVFEVHKAGGRVVGATVDHGLQDGSAEQAARVVAQLAGLGADETVSARVVVEAAGLGPEAAAREARYAVLEQMREHFGADAVLLGHTRDDQAETVLMGLARGSGARSLAGMRRSFDAYLRPLLDVARLDTVTACQVEGITWWDDPHNSDPAYLRARVRSAVLPVLETELGPGVAAALARTADQLRDDVALLDELAEQEAARLDGLPVDRLRELPAAVRRRVLHRAVLAAGAPAAEVTYDHVLAVDGLLTAWHGQKWIDLPGPLRAVRRDGELAIGPPG